MARIHGTPGKSARTLSDKRWLLSKIVLLCAIIVVWVLVWAFSKFSAVLTGSTTLAAILVVVILLKWIDITTAKADRHLRKRTSDADRGAAGEDAVAALLAALPDEYDIFHDLAKLAGDIDHIVVGPTGIFVIETKSHRGKVRADGNRILVDDRPPEKDFINQSWRNAYWVRDVLKNAAGIEVTVTPILVFTNAFVDISRPVKGVQVINKNQLVKIILQARPAEFPTEYVAEILLQKLGGT